MGILEAIFAFAAFVVTGVQHLVRHVVRELSTHLADSVARNADDAIRDLKATDSEIEEIERKGIRDGSLPTRDQDQLAELSARRDQEFNAFQDARTDELTRECRTNPSDFGESVLTDDKVNVVQYHLGQPILAKRCKKCGNPMELKEANDVDGLRRFFWGCTGYFRSPPCSYKESFRDADAAMLHLNGIPELETTHKDLETVVSDPHVQTAIVKRMKNHLWQRDDNHLCAEHHVALQLRQKVKHDGTALDMFHLGCPHEGCGYTQKLKSAAQLAAFLRGSEGKGIL